MEKVKISPGCCFFWAFLLLTLPLHWMTAAVLAAAFHEICHLAAISALGGRAEGFSLGILGARIRVSGLNYGREFLAAAAGPAGSLMLIPLLSFCPELSLCGLFQGLFNLLPVWPLDGGRMVFCLLCLVFSRNQAEKLGSVIENGCLFLILSLSILCWIRTHSGPLLPALALAAIIGAKIRKNPCKPGFFAVQ